jgi:2-oxoisovalerate dehydrogenase E2 component (dihydrolipoyl transacylase)
VPRDSVGPRLSPAVRKLALDSGIDATSLRGSGENGRVTRRNMLAAISERQGAASKLMDGREELIAITPMRRAIGEHMVRSVSTSPHAWVLFEVDISPLVAYRSSRAEDFRQRYGVPLTYLPFVIPIVCDCLREHPVLNSSWSDDAIILHQDINISVAISIENGLIVPVIPAADRLGMVDLARVLAELAEGARMRRLRPEDVRGGTFTVNNSGVIGAVTSKPIINQPQAGIMTTQKIVRRPLVVGEAIEVREVMNMALSFDHRILDVFQSGAFMASVKQRLESWSPADVRL